MSELNPYAAPLATGPLDAEAVQGKGGIWREATTLVIWKGAELPDRCVRCNAPAFRPAIALRSAAPREASEEFATFVKEANLEVALAKQISDKQALTMHEDQIAYLKLVVSIEKGLEKKKVAQAKQEMLIYQKFLAKWVQDEFPGSPGSPKQ